MLHSPKQKNIINQSQSGVTLLEVVIAFFVLSLGLLGVIQLQALSLRQSQEAHLNAIAIFQAQNLLEQFRMWQVSPNSSAANELLAEWEQETQQYLPNSEASVAIENNQRIVYLFWQDVTLNSAIPCAWFPEEKQMCLRWAGADEIL